MSSDSPLERMIDANSRCSSFSVGAVQKPAHADDRVHRRADLVAHRCQEGALGLRRGLGLLARPLELGDVVIDDVEAGMLAVDEQWHHDHLDVDKHTVPSHPVRDPVGATLLERLAGHADALVAQCLRPQDEVVDVAADRLIGAESEQRGRRRVPGGYALVAVERHDGHRADLDERLEVLLLSVQLGGSLLDPVLERLDVLAQLSGHVVEGEREGAHLVLGRNRCLPREVAGGDRRRRVGNREDGLRDPPRHPVDPACEQGDDAETDEADREREVTRRREGLVLAHLGDQAVSVSSSQR